MNDNVERSDLLAHTTAIVIAAINGTRIIEVDIAKMISSTYAALAGTAQPAQPEVPKQEPAVPIRSSVQPDHIVCLEDGKKLKMLKRYLRTNFDMSPDEYRSKWGLPSDYPMVCNDYAEVRRGLAKASGLGTKNGGRKPGIKDGQGKRR
jgi:predicted transcriptional regulator